MKHLLLVALACVLSGCAGFGEHFKQTATLLAPRIAGVLAKAALNSAVQSLSGGEKADFMDSAAAGLRTVSLSNDDIGSIVKIWTTPPKESTPPEMRVVAAKADELAQRTGADTETMAKAFNIAAAKIRTVAE